MGCRTGLAGRNDGFVHFSGINRPGSTGFEPGLQKHHLLPKQLLKLSCFAGFFETLLPEDLIFDDFGANGVLLPATEQLAVRHRLPLHRGPHGRYNELVIERVAAIESRWSAMSRKGRRSANAEARERIGLLQRALRRRLQRTSQRPFVLNRRDPIGAGLDFTELDAMADVLWAATRH